MDKHIVFPAWFSRCFQCEAAAVEHVRFISSVLLNPTDAAAQSEEHKVKPLSTR